MCYVSFLPSSAADTTNRESVGRPFLYGAILAGQAGVEQVIKHTMADLDTTLGLSGYVSLDEIHGIGEEIVKKIDFET